MERIVKILQIKICEILEVSKSAKNQFQKFITIAVDEIDLYFLVTAIKNTHMQGVKKTQTLTNMNILNNWYIKLIIYKRFL